MSWLLPAALMVFPMLLAVVAAQQSLFRRRLRLAAGAALCARCGAELGLPALDRANAAWRAEMSIWHAAHSDHRPRVVRRLWAICPACGAAHKFDPAMRRFVLLETEGSDQAAP